MSGHAGAGDGRADDDAVPGGIGHDAVDRLQGASLPDGKDAAAFRTIGEVGRALNIASHVLRYWEEQFPMLRPVKRSGGRRYYRPADIALLEQIHGLVHQQGYTLRGARQYLEGREALPPAKAPAPRAASLLDDLIALREDLAGLLNDQT